MIMTLLYRPRFVVFVHIRIVQVEWTDRVFVQRKQSCYFDLWCATMLNGPHSDLIRTGATLLGR